MIQFIKQHDGEELESSIIFTKRPPKKGKTASTKKMSEEMAVASEPETAAASEETAVVPEVRYMLPRSTRTLDRHVDAANDP